MTMKRAPFVSVIALFGQVGALASLYFERSNCLIGKWVVSFEVGECVYLKWRLDLEEG